MNQTENTETHSSDEQIRKIYAKDLKVGETVHTVFKALRKEKHHSRAGKPYLTMLLVDRTGEVDGRVFENVEAADGAFQSDDYLLLKGKVGSFHGKAQIVIERLERLDPGPIDAREFAWTPAPVEEKAAPAPREKAEKKEKEEAAPKAQLAKRLHRLLDNPQVTQALEVLVTHLERYIDERIQAKLGGPQPRAERPERAERKGHGPKVERKGEAGAEAVRHEPKHEAKRDPSLPEGLAFKPFTALVGDGGKSESNG